MKVLSEGDALERSVDGDVADGGEQGEGAGEQVGFRGKEERAAEDGAEAEDESVRQADSSGDHGTRGSALHARVGAALERLVEDGGAAGDNRDAAEGVGAGEVRRGRRRSGGGRGRGRRRR